MVELINIDFASISKKGLSKSLLTEIIDNQAILVINDFPQDDATLNGFINQMGKPIVDFRSDSTIFEVKPVKRNDFFQSFANSNYYFSLHTDCSDFEVIPNGLAMLCVIPAKHGGESMFIKLDEIMAHLNEDEQQMLLEKQWLFRNIKRPILSRISNADGSDNVDKNTGYRICYNRIMLEGYTQLTEEELAFLDKFDTLVIEHSFEYKLQENQLIICNNHTLLHGRKEFDENEERLLKRIRFDFYE